MTNLKMASKVAVTVVLLPPSVRVVAPLSAKPVPALIHMALSRTAIRRSRLYLTGVRVLPPRPSGGQVRYARTSTRGRSASITTLERRAVPPKVFLFAPSGSWQQRMEEWLSDDSNAALPEK